MTEPVETPDVESTEEKPKRKGGKKPFTITAASREYERAKADLAKLTRGSDKVQKAEEKLRKAQAAYDEAVAAQEDNSADVAEAQAKVDEAKAKLDEALANG